MFGCFSPNLDPQTPNFHENHERPRFGRFWGPFAGGKKFGVTREKKGPFRGVAGRSGAVSGLQRPSSKTHQAPHPGRGFHRKRLPAGLTKITGFTLGACSQPPALALTAPKVPARSIRVWNCARGASIAISTCVLEGTKTRGKNWPLKYQGGTGTSKTSRHAHLNSHNLGQNSRRGACSAAGYPAQNHM